ncbi:nicotinate-nucleotide--dimethylbenzimidazole phosphoribosyltransferase [Pelagibius marinus]|uniref:nicotinate-nucleotide--dimethylbenzimidazole phosphoribosyltransferase n=1 Tax=Pelagibius marinus TaxID=2762760 RepID=UPI001872CAC3|nr:nicotinate-nucleotide--dimethylbenzimidazole phosphoribosyltransferase [Pelagibius marinus]
MAAAEDIASLEEIRELLKVLPAADAEAGEIARERQAQLTKPAGSLGRLEDLAVWLATWQGRNPPSVDRPYTAVFAGNHGVAAKGVSAYPPEVTAQMVQNFIEGGAAVNQLCSLANADLRVYEMALEEPTGDLSEGPAMSEEDCARAMAYGMMAVESGIDVLALGEMGIGNTTAAAALCHGLFGGEAADWVGAGTGIDDVRRAEKAALVEKAVILHRDALDDPLQVLCRLGGRELAAIAGAILAARMARTPVMLDGYACTAAAAVLYALDPEALDHCQVSHMSAEPGHKRLLARIGKRPLVDLDMRLGEASGAMVAVLLLKAAVACHNGMATFADAGVSGPSENE